MRLGLLFLISAVTLAACATTEDATRERTPRVDQRAGQGGVTLARTDDRVRTVLLHRTGHESALPVIAIGSGQTLTLSFDLVGEQGAGPVSVFFYHADRHWNRRLLAVEYMRGFQADDIRDYEPSAATRVPYTNYAYRFPNRTIEFTRSGNFIVRVTELGDERAVLFERPFFLTEEIAEVDMDVRSGLGAGLGGPFLQPVAQIRPPARFDSPIFEYDVCFARDGRFDLVRCADEPTLLGATLFQFYLPEDRAFGPPDPRHVLDLSVIGAGPQIAAVDMSTTPYSVELAPDDERFTPAFFDEGLLSGQSLVESAVRTTSRPGIFGEYVDVTFRYVPEGREPLAGRVFLSGSFNGWVIDPSYRLEWNGASRQYEGTFLLKQGQYTYTYHVEDPQERARRARTLEAGRPTLYTGFVYLRDPAYNTDRLLAVRNRLGQ
jgi:hypothetical protein